MAYEIPHQLLRLPAALAARGGIGRTKHYRDIELGLMTHPVPIAGNCVGWPLREIVAINAARVSGCSEAEVRALVDRLEGERARALDEVLSAMGFNTAASCAVPA